ncbi:MAG: ABC transporter permease [Oscillospiraceae bacterium]|nr:ABC transporter permease [Oscillospiraceae bacterium]
MRNIMRADLYRIFHSKGVYIAIAVFLAMTVLQVFFPDGQMGIMVATETYTTIQNEDGTWEVIAPEKPLMTGKTMPFKLAETTDNLIFFLLPFIVFIATADFSHGAVKNLISSGISRKKYFLAKLVLLSLTCIVIMLLYVLISIVLATILRGFGGDFSMDFIGSLAEVYLPQFYLLYAFVCVGFFLGFAFRSTAMLNTVYIAFALLPSLVFSVLAFNNPQLEVLFKYIIPLGIKTFAFEQKITGMPSADLTHSILLGGTYIFVCVIGGFLLFRKAEIK